MSRKKSILKVLILSALFVMVLGLMMTSFAEENVAQVQDGKSYPTLEEAITDVSDGGTITLLKGFDVTNGITVNKSITLDFATFTINFTGNELKNCLTITEGKEVTLKDGNIKSNNNASPDGGFPAAVAIKNGTLKLENMKIDAENGAAVSLVPIEGGIVTNKLTVDVKSILTNKTNGTISTRSDGTNKATHTVGVYGTVTNTGTYSAINGGYHKNNNTTIHIYKGAKLSSTSGAGVLQMSEGTVTVEDGATITGFSSGVSLTKGSLVVNGGTISATGDWQEFVGTANQNVNDNGAAVYVEPTSGEINVTISGGELSSTNASAISSTKPNEDSNITMKISGGVFEGNETKGGAVSIQASGATKDIKEYVDNASVVKVTASGKKEYYVGESTKDIDVSSLKADDTIDVLEGNYAVEGVVEGVKVKNEGEGTVTVNDIPVKQSDNEVTVTEPVAEVNGNKYLTLKAAVTAAQANAGTITLLKDIEIEAFETIGNSLMIDLKGHSITRKNGPSVFSITGGEVIIKDSLGGGKLVGGDSSNSPVVGVSENAKLTVDANATITGANPGVAVLGNGQLTVNEGATITSTGSFAIATNGSKSTAPTITITGGTLTGGAAAIYLPKGKLTVKDGDITGQAGIVVRGGTLNVEGGNITATGTGTVQVGDAGTESPAAAVVVDKTGNYGASSVTITDGTFVANGEKPAVVYTEGSAVENTNNVNNALTVKGGNFSASVDEAYLDDSLTAELEKKGEEAPFSYYTSLADANAKKENGDDAHLLESKANTATLVDFGFKANRDDANKAINDSFTKLGVEAEAWNITDCVEDTMYATFKGTGTATDYVVKFYKGTVSPNNIVYDSTKEQVPQVTNGCVVYFSFHHQAQPEQLVSGAYVVELYTKEQDETLVSTATLNISKVTFKKADGDETEYQLPADTYYAQGEKITLPTLSRSGYNFLGWEANGETYTGTYTVSETGADVTLTATWSRKSSGGSSTTRYTITVRVGENGTVSPSGNVKVEEGKDQKFVFTPYTGYEVEDVLVDGKSVGAVSSYRFDNVKEKHTLTVTFKKVEETTPTPSQRYNDVTEDAWYYDAVEFVSEEGFMEGTGNNVFNPELPITRGMMATVLYRLSGANTKKTSDFVDVASNSYYTNAIAWAADNGIVTGVGNNLFEPDRQIKREELAAMLARYLKNMNIDITNSGVDLAYDDATSISDYAKDFVKTMRLTGLMQGKNGNNFDAAGMATRAEVATILMRYVESTNK